jgi:hypothetical protein
VSHAELPRVALVMPHYGDVSLGAARGLLVDAVAEGRATPVVVMDSCSSSTPHCFNMLLAFALDARDRGEVSHIAMLHSDIVPQRGWLDVLADEMAAHNADLVSAVVPIKEPARERTSTAIGAIGNPWHPARYVTMADRPGLPPTFGPEHVCGEGEELLVNTGCFLADLRRPWWDNFAFNFDCRIIQRDGRRVAQFNPEDWQMSRVFNAAGAVVRATWRVSLTHCGSGEWPNR